MRRALLNSRAQSSVELVLAVPLVVLVMFAGWQLVVAGHTWWKVAEVARLAAREYYVADQRGQARAGVRRGRALADVILASSPSSSRRLEASRSGRLTVQARVPLVAPFRAALGASAGPLVSSSSRMAP